MEYYKFKKLLVFFIISVIYTGCFKTVSAQEFRHEKLLSFEELNQEKWSKTKGNNLSLSNKHYKNGAYSLCWTWKKTGSITLNKAIGFKPFNPEGEDKAIPSFAVWIYNENPVNDHIKFVFGTDGSDNCHFSFGLNFKGWRAAWVSFERDMQGEPVSSMNMMRIETPESVNKGQLFIDHMFLCHNIDSRHHTPDYQVPFVNKGTTNSWLIQQEASKAVPDIEAEKVITEEQIASFKTIEKRFYDDIVKKQKVDGKYIEKLTKQFQHYNIERKGAQISGLPIWFGRNAELYIPFIDWKEAKGFYDKGGQNVNAYFDFMLKVATAYVNVKDEGHKKQLHSMFMDLYEHMVDQGFAAGSGLGTIHHYGYNWRSYYRSLFIMKSVLRSEGRLQEAVEGMQWFAAVGEVFYKPEIYGMDMDAFNTQVMGRLASILIMENSPQKVQYLKCFSRWIDNGLMPAPGLNDAFKIDGSAYHHANNYPAYATGGFTGAVRMVYFMSGTSFKVSKEAHGNLKKALLTMRFYCNKLHWPTTMSGRHPEGRGKLIPDHFAILAKAGSPDGNEAVDNELGAAYLRLVDSKKTSFTNEFLQQGIKAETTPQGHISMPYASSSIHRRGEWVASVRGHSRYLWAAEHYIGANLYGRYLAHGQLQIMGFGNPVTANSSGFVQQGWDWNRFPGTTVINLPVADLRADIKNVDQFSGYEEMLFSDEAFAGGVVSGSQNGIYAFILHEHDKYQGSLRARKSYFFFDDKIVCLGSGIENDNKDRPTETTLFQNNLADGDSSLLLNGVVLHDKELEVEGAENWMMDNKGNGYLIPYGNIFFKQGLQESRDESSEKVTKGNFASAVLNHGKAPQNASYSYCVLPGTSSDNIRKAASDPGYKVLCQTKEKHIVYNEGSSEMAYVFFEAADENNVGIIMNTSLPCLAISKINGESLTLNVANPDLALYNGSADEIYKDGKRVERSIYSRPWRSSESQETDLTVELNGAWHSADQKINTVITNEGSTIVTFKCKDGMTQSVDLVRK